MNNRNVILGMLLAVLFFGGCQKYDEIGTAPQRFTTLTAGVSADTKVNIDGLVVTWKETDTLYVVEYKDTTFSSGQSYSIPNVVHPFPIVAGSISTDGKSAEFKSNITLKEGVNYAAMTAGGKIGIASNNNLFIPYKMGVQTKSGSSDHFEDWWYMRSAFFTGSADNSLSIVLSNQQSVLSLELKLKAGVSGSVPVSKVTFTSPHNGSFVYPWDGGYSTTNSVSMEVGDAVISDSKSYIANIPMMWSYGVTELTGDFEITIETPSGLTSKTTFPARALTHGKLYTATLEFENFSYPAEKIERDALMALYNATDGPNWTNNTNWGSDKPLSEWHGIALNHEAKVYFINLSENNLKGAIPAEIGNLSNLIGFYCYGNQLSGAIPTEIGNLTNLTSIYLHDNQLSGSIPKELAELPKLTHLYLKNNNLTGDIPESYTKDQSRWNYLAWNIVKQNDGYGFNHYPDVYIEPSSVTTINGVTINTTDFFKQNKLTCVVVWRTWCGFSKIYLEELKSLYQSYSAQGFNILSTSDQEDITLINEYVTQSSLPGQVFQTTYDGTGANNNYITYFPTSISPTFAFVDSTGRILYSENFTSTPLGVSREEATRGFVTNVMDDGKGRGGDKYESSDYSKNGEVMVLQRATVGKGIPIVLMGDGFVDLDMGTDGLYEQRMKEGMEHFFSEEPYTSFRNRFTIYAVKAVSKHSGVMEGNTTTFGTQFGEGTHVGGTHSKVFEYTLKISEITSLRDLPMIVIVNSPRYAGTCYMYSDNRSVAFCPTIDNDPGQFRKVLLHECGHGFAKLADEYDYPGTITQTAIDSFLAFSAMGWYENVDITPNRDEVKWAHFFKDSRYTEQVGIYEGAFTYQYGVYRPTEESIMRHNIMGFNAPSRQSIYRQIMELSGDAYTYEKFLEYDARNRTKAAVERQVALAAGFDKSTFVPFAPPVYIEEIPEF